MLGRLAAWCWSGPAACSSTSTRSCPADLARRTTIRTTATSWSLTAHPGTVPGTWSIPRTRPGFQGHLHDRAGRQGAWDGTKDEGGAYFIIEIPPSGQIPVPKEQGPWHGGDPSAAKIISPNEIPWQGAQHNERALLAGDPSKPGVYVMMSKWPKGSFSHPHFHSADRYVYVPRRMHLVEIGPVRQHCVCNKVRENDERITLRFRGPSIKNHLVIGAAPTTMANEAIVDSPAMPCWSVVRSGRCASIMTTWAVPYPGTGNFELA